LKNEALQMGVLTFCYLSFWKTMRKTRTSIAKRFKVTGSGKIMRRTPGRRHLLRKKSNRQIRSAQKDKQVISKGYCSQIKAAMPGVF